MGGQAGLTKVKGAALYEDTCKWQAKHWGAPPPERQPGSSGCSLGLCSSPVWAAPIWGFSGARIKVLRGVLGLAPKVSKTIIYT